MLSRDDTGSAAPALRPPHRATGTTPTRSSPTTRPAVKAPLADASLVNGWGLSAGPTTPWWTSNNKTNTSTLYSGAGVKSALTVSVPGGPTGTVFNGNASRLHRQRQRQERLRSVPLRDAGGDDPRLVADRQRKHRRHGRSTTPRKARSTTGSRRSTTTSTRPTSTTRASTSSTRTSLPSRSPTRFVDKKIPKGWAPFGIQALEREHLRHLREAGSDEAPRRRRRRARLRRPVRPQRRAARARRQARAPRRRSTRPGDSRWRPQPSAASAATCSSATSGTGRSAPTSRRRSRRGSGSTRASSGIATGEIIKIPGLLGDRLRQRRGRRLDEQPLLPLGAKRARRTGCSESSPWAERRDCYSISVARRRPSADQHRSR